ncbi:MAG: hypothetical protein LBP39_00505 [Rickettsiales bacterium]|jgi:hypothetical protein|nr:hypothetical protein [Rickettsiales bacterium]
MEKNEENNENIEKTNQRPREVFLIALFSLTVAVSVFLSYRFGRMATVAVSAVVASIFTILGLSNANKDLKSEIQNNSSTTDRTQKSHWKQWFREINTEANWADICYFCILYYVDQIAMIAFFPISGFFVFPLAGFSILVFISTRADTDEKQTVYISKDKLYASRSRRRTWAAVLAGSLLNSCAVCLFYYFSQRSAIIASTRAILVLFSVYNVLFYVAAGYIVSALEPDFLINNRQNIRIDRDELQAATAFYSEKSDLCRGSGVEDICINGFLNSCRNWDIPLLVDLHRKFPKDLLERVKAKAGSLGIAVPNIRRG